MLLSFIKDDNNVFVKENKSIIPAWHMRTMVGIELKEENNEFYDLYNAKREKVNTELSTLLLPENKSDNSLSVVQNNEIKFLVVNQILGTFSDSGIVAPYHYRLVMHYWRDKAQDPTPLVISYEYQAS